MVWGIPLVERCAARRDDRPSGKVRIARSAAACGASQEIQCAGAFERLNPVVRVELRVDVLDVGARGVR